MSESRQPGPLGANLGRDPFSEVCRKVVLLIAEDRLALAHFRPLIGLLKEISHALVVVTRSTGHLSEIEELGARVIDFDYRHASDRPLRGLASAWAVGRILEAENPDVVHLVGPEPVVIGGLGLRLVPSRHVIVQMSGLGPFGGDPAPGSRLYRAGALRLMRSMVRQASSCLLVENADDLAYLRQRGVDPGARFAILGGSGVDPQAFEALPAPANDTAVAAFPDGTSRHSGIDVLMRAHERLCQRGAPLRLQIYEGADADSQDQATAETVSTWCAQHQAQWLGRAGGASEVWRRADICVLPVRGGGGLPRALLEAAACARPLVVTDVPGCRHFVRDGVEGLIVPPEDADALADALERLARDAEARQRMGEAARLRLLHGFTEAHVKQSLRAVYASMAGRASGS